MTPADQRMLRALKKSCEDLGRDLKAAYDAGYMVEFNINNVSGEVGSFNVKQTIAIDLDQDTIQ